MSQKGGELIGMGSFGCVFNPSLKCPGDKVNQDDVVSKVFFNKDGRKELNQEYKLTTLIRNIPGSENWSEVWYKKCKPDNYDKLYNQDSEIEDCLEENNIDPYEFNKIRMMLQGRYGGETFTDYCRKKFTKKVFSSKKDFTKQFLDIVKKMKPLFIGLQAMYKKGIGHNDIKNDNIVIDEGGCRYIDFGFSSKYTDKKFYKKRGSLEFLTDRIYPPYPYEFIFLYATPEILEENDKYDLQYGLHRSLHDRYLLVHEDFFNRKVKYYLPSLVDKFIKEGSAIQKGVKGNRILSLLDTYSLGMLLPFTLSSLAKNYGKIKAFKRYISSNPIHLIKDLFYHMTEPDAEERMNPNDVYDKYLEIEKLYLTKQKTKKRTNRRTRKA